MAKCRGCGAEISFIQAPSGKQIPVDSGYITIVPCKEGKIAVVTTQGAVVRGDRVGDAYEGGNAVSGRISHFATCPAAFGFGRCRIEG